MSDILIAQEVGTVVVIETAPAEIVEVVAVGPQGPVGDVNPQMPVILAATEAARDAALASEQAAAASQSAAATSAANAATSESNAATSAATATAQATASAGSATDSAGSAAAAQASAANAAASESNAAASATASANSATSSANSATAAQAAQTATESARDTTLATIGTAALKANNLSDLASIPTALINLGLNNVSNTSDANKPVSTATQAALNLKADAASPTTTGTFTHSGDVVLSGSGKRITGDFSNATIANRVMFQTSTVNANTSIFVIPNGTATATALNTANNSDPTNASITQLQTSSSESVLSANRTGTGTYLPMTFYTRGSERMRIDASGNVGIGAVPDIKFSVVGPAGGASAKFTDNINSTLIIKHESPGNLLTYESVGVAQQRWVLNSVERMRIDSSGNVGIGAAPVNDFDVLKTKPAGNVIGRVVNTDPGASSGAYHFVAQGSVSLFTAALGNAAGYFGTASNHPMYFYTNNSVKLAIDTSGNVLATGSGGGLGYGTGAGGTVTQATSKSTAVTLNKPTGQITMHNAALAAGATVYFAVFNSLVTTSDLVVAHHNNSVGTADAYDIKALYTSAGAFRIKVTNTSAGSLSEAVIINFAIIKGAVA